MGYLKNVGPKERVARLLAGALMAAAALSLLGTTTAGWALAAGGAMLALTGVLGYCPACALAGRRPLDGPR